MRLWILGATAIFALSYGCEDKRTDQMEEMASQLEGEAAQPEGTTAQQKGASADTPYFGEKDDDTDLDDVVDEPAEVQGQRVSIEGELEKDLGKGFILEEEGLGQDKVLVISPDARTRFTKGDHVRVMGTVRNATLSTIESEHDIDGLESEIEIEIESELVPYVVATNVTRMEE